MVLDDKSAVSFAFQDKLEEVAKGSQDIMAGSKSMKLTSQRSIYATNIHEQTHFRKLHRKARSFKHFISRNFGAFKRIENSVDVEFTKGDFRVWSF
jgi:hypothetical protein